LNDCTVRRRFECRLRLSGGASGSFTGGFRPPKGDNRQHWYIDFMLPLRRPDLPGLCLALMLAVAFVLPEVGHTHAHRHLAEHESEAAHHEAPTATPGSGLALGDHHDDEQHEHLSLVATPTAKALVLGDPTITTLALPHYHFRTARIPALVVTSSLPPGLLEHGPPPPSRAPPLV
jgi:hypothetical protein